MRPLTKLQPSKNAINAIKAAKGFHNWGYYATRGFIRNQKVPYRLVMLAVFLEDGVI